MQKLLFIVSLLLLTCPNTAYTSTDLVKNSSITRCYKVVNNQDSLFLDIYLPEKNANKQMQVLMMIHGGAWEKGKRDLEDYYSQQFCSQLLDSGVAVISIDYRLINEHVHFPAPLIDCIDAVRWIRANAEKFHFDSNKIGLWGASAGGHLAMMVANANDSLWSGDPKLATYSSKVNFVVDFFGPTNINELFKVDAGKLTLFTAHVIAPGLVTYRNRILYAFTGFYIDDQKERIHAIANVYSPILYVNPSVVPTLIFHGTKDRVVPIKQSKELYKILKKEDVETDLYVVKKGNHGFSTTSQQKIDELVLLSVNFVLKHS